jgi:hypothetical protein
MITKRVILRALAAAGLGISGVRQATAQAYPSRGAQAIPDLNRPQRSQAAKRSSIDAAAQNCARSRAPITETGPRSRL